MAGPAAAPSLEPLPQGGSSGAAKSSPILATATILGNVPITDEYRRLTLNAPAMAAAAQPGQFVMLTIARPGESSPVLPRPMAIYTWDEAAGTIDIAYRIVGSGTRRLAGFAAGEALVVVGPLGRGFTLPERHGTVLLLGRGIGTCSLTSLAAVATGRGHALHALASARTRAALVGGDVYRAAGAAAIIEATDDDGSSDAALLRERLEPLARDLAGIYVCGSNRLLALGVDLAGQTGAEVQVSLEAHMACGLGYCHGCAAGRPGLPHETPLVCADGPVFRHVAPAS